MWKKHMCMVDICRFAAILMIMGHHRYILGYTGNYLFANGWAWVEYFFMLTGYFTMAHFEKLQIEQKDYGREALQYTFKKVSPFIKYVFAATLIEYVVEGFHFVREGNVVQFFKEFVNFPFEIGLLTSAEFSGAKNAPIWYLSAMFLVLPLLICCMLKWKDIWVVVSFMLPILYYGKMGINTERLWPNDLIRAYVAMTFGMFAYYVAQTIKKCTWNNNKKIVLTSMEVISFLLAIYITAFNKSNMDWLIFLFLINISIMLSGCSATSNIHGRKYEILGQITLPMFIFHWPMGAVALHFSQEPRIKMLIYYVATVLVAIGVTVLSNLVNKHKKMEEICDENVGKHAK